MAKATAPLFAIEASGQIGKTVVYDRRGFVRIYTVPSNPKTDDQIKVRCQFKAMAAGIKATKAHAREAIKAKVEPSYRWSAEAIGAALKNNGWNLHVSQFVGFSDTVKSDWDTAAQSVGLNVDATAPCFSQVTAHTNGFALYAYTRGLKDIGIMPDSGTDSPDDWATFLTAS